VPINKFVVLFVAVIFVNSSSFKELFLSINYFHKDY
jgi:hypothetical protein